MPIGCSYSDFIGRNKLLDNEKQAEEQKKEEFNGTLFIDNTIPDKEIKISKFNRIIIKDVIIIIAIFIIIYGAMKYAEKYINPDELKTLFDAGIVTIIILGFNIINISGTFT